MEAILPGCFGSDTKRSICCAHRGDREAGSGGVGTFQPPPLTPSPPRQGENRGQNGQAAPPWPDSQALAEAGLGHPSIRLQNGHANGTRWVPY
jgi:hypothetical protein